MASPSMPVAVAFGAVGAGRGAGAVLGAGTVTYVAEDGDSCGLAPPRDELLPVEIRFGS